MILQSPWFQKVGYAALLPFFHRCPVKQASSTLTLKTSKLYLVEKNYNNKAFHKTKKKNHFAPEIKSVQGVII